MQLKLYTNIIQTSPYFRRNCQTARVDDGAYQAGFWWASCPDAY